MATNPDELFTTPAPEDLFEPRPNAVVSENIAANRAHADVLTRDEPNSFAARKEGHKYGTVEDATVGALSEIFERQRIIDTGILDPDAGLTSEERIQAIRDSIMQVDFRDITTVETATLAFFLHGGGDLPAEEIEKRYKKLNISEIDDFQDQMVHEARYGQDQIVNEIAATKGFTNYGDMFLDAAIQDGIPIFDVLSRIGLTKEVAKAVDAPLSGTANGFLLGSLRESIRDTLTNATPNEYAEKMAAFGNLMHDLERDEILGPLLTRYNQLEMMQAVFTPEVYAGLQNDDTFDIVFGNLESALLGLFSVMTIAKAGRYMKGLFGGTDALMARKAASLTNRKDLAAGFDEIMQQDDIAIPMGFAPDEVAPVMLPRPAVFADDMADVPDGTKDLIARTERQRSEILDSTDALTGSGLTPQDKTSTINKAIEDLSLNDSLHVQGRMNTLRMKAGDAGFDMRVVVGETAEGGFKDLEVAMKEVLDIDPLLEKVDIHRINQDGVLEPVFESQGAFQRAAFKGQFDTPTAGRLLGDTPDDSFYLVYDTEHFWHTVDKAVLSPESFLSTGVLPRAALAPNAKFGDEIYGTFVRATLGERALLKNFEGMFAPYYQLGVADKKFAASAFEWMEDFGKQKGRSPTIAETMAHYDGITEAQLNGVTSLRAGYDTMYELFNRKLYRDMQGLNYKSARPRNTTMPTFHGNNLDRGDVPGGTFLDPETQRLVTMTQREIDDLYNTGGRVMKLDIALDAGPKAKADLVLLKHNKYDVGELTTRPLTEYPGYHFRFYDDPYYVVKETEGISLNGSKRATTTHVEAVRTAGTAREAEDFARRAQFTDNKRGVTGVTWRPVRASTLDNTESNLFSKDALHREGRLFWDERNADQLPDVNNNRARLEDPVKSLERGTAIMARQITHEDPIKQLKNAWKNEFGHLIDDKQMLERLDVGELSNRLKKVRREAVTAADRTQAAKAKELVDYLRLIEGTEQYIVPFMREQSINIAAWVGRTTGANTRAAEKYFQTMDPFRTMRTIAFNAFMVFRPFRQALLQSSQIGYLAGLAPRYVASRQFFKDAVGLRRGLTALRKSGYDDGFSKASLAKSMGLTKKEYNVLIREFDRSGLVDTVDVHSFAGGTRQSQKVAIPRTDSRMGTVGYRTKQVPIQLRDWAQKIGFNFGERNNLTFTYNLALKRTMDKKGYKSVLDLSRKDWDDLRVDASNLALGMIRPNNFGYQTGALGVATQFLSFSHKAALGLLGANPAIKGKDVFRILGMGYLLYGANMFGARDLAKEYLVSMQIDDREIEGTGGTLVDFISAGIMENGLNMLFDMTSDDYKDIDFQFLVPGVDFQGVWEMQLESLLDQPLQAPFGAFGNIFSKTQESYKFMSAWHAGSPDIEPGEKFLQAGHAMAMGLFPAYNDAVMSYMGYQMGLWYTRGGEALPLRPTMNGMLARGVFGARTKEELNYFAQQSSVWENVANKRNIIEENQKIITRFIAMFNRGELTRDQFQRNLQWLSNMVEEAPEGVRLEILRESMITQVAPGNPTLIQQLMESIPDVQNPAAFIARVDEFTDIPVERREQLKQLMLESWQSRVAVEDKILQEVRDDLE